jgi:glycosyltransferase involved in cell wall biosynthesis
MSLPRLSVVVPNYNHATYLPRSLQALVDQSVQPLEIIVIDDASTDNSVEVIESFAAKYPIFRFYRNENNRGVLFSVSRGLELATGDYVLTAAADDEVLPGFFEKSLRLLGKHPEAALSATSAEYREAHTGVHWIWGAGIVKSPSYLSPTRMVECERKGRFYIPPNSVIFRLNALREVGNFIPELKFCCDWYATYVAGFRYGICFVPEPLAVFHVQPNSYYHRLRRNETEYSEVLEELLRRLNQPENRDVLPLLRESGSLFLFAHPMLKVLLRHPEFRHLITPRFLCKNLAHSAKLFFKKHSPAWFVNLCLQCSGYRTR